MGNIEILMMLDAEEYPALYKKLHAYGGAMLAKLSNVITTFQGREPAYTDRTGRKWYFSSFRFWVGAYGGSLSTWSDIIHYSAAVHLLEIVKPTKKSIPAPMRKAWKTAKGKGQQAELFYHVPPYSLDVLSAAEHEIRLLNEQGINRSGFTKAAAILAVGQDAANHVFIDGRRMSAKEKATERELIKAIKAGIIRRGYITKEAAMRAARVQLVSRKRRMKKAEAVSRINRIWKSRNKHILSDAEAVYHRPSKEEKARFGLDCDGWIITAKQNAPVQIPKRYHPYCYSFVTQEETH